MADPIQTPQPASSAEVDSRYSAGRQSADEAAQGRALATLHPWTNIGAGPGYLLQQYRKFGNWHDALVGYNAGPERVGNPPAESVRYADSIVSRVQGGTPMPPGGAIRPGAPEMRARIESG